MRLDPSEYEVLVESSPHMIWRCGADGRRDFFNRTWLDFTGRDLDAALGDGWREAIHPDDLQSSLKIYIDAIDARAVYEARYRLRRSDGEWRWVNDMGAPFHAAGRFAGYIGGCVDINESMRAEQLKDLALADGLTGLYRRRYFEERLEEEMRRAKRYHSDLPLVKLDVDDFKDINRKYGRPAADKVLKAVACMIRENVRSHDLACRLGGDEFCLALPHAGVADAEHTAGRIRDLIQNETLTFDRQPIDFSISFVVIALADEPNAAKFISKADRALFEAKRRGPRQAAA